MPVFRAVAADDAGHVGSVPVLVVDTVADAAHIEARTNTALEIFVSADATVYHGDCDVFAGRAQDHASGAPAANG
jgi:hypothetical protein